MKRLFTLSILIFFLTMVSRGQITKGNWLLGGSATFSSTKTSSDLGGQDYTLIQVTGNAGYFFMDKLVAGLKPDLLFVKTKTEFGNHLSNRSGFGPFIRYYFLSQEQRMNLFLESSYSYGINKVSNQKGLHSNSFSFFGGPVIFLNPTVGLEFSMGYTIIKVNDGINSQRNIFQTGIGFQFHLEKE